MDMESTDDENENKEPDGSISSRPVLNCITAKVATQRDATHYNMNHKNRGIALIFNHEKFESLLNLERRLGTNKDAVYMERTLTELGFKVFVHRNNKFSAIMRRIREAVQYDHTHYDCFVMVVLTHGSTNDFLFANDTSYSFANLWLPFRADSCLTLAGKPKLFFIQACRGQKFMPPVSLQIDSSRSCTGSYKIPSHADFLFFYSSSPGYVSLRNIETGTWFIQALCRQLESNAYNYDILTLLTFVTQRVAIDCEAYLNNTEPSTGELKQIPCINTNLTRLVLFKEKTNLIEYPNCLKKKEVTESKPKASNAMDAIIEKGEVTGREEILDTAVATANEELVETKNIQEEQPTDLAEDYGDNEQQNLNLEEGIVNLTVQVEILPHTEFFKSLLFFAIIHKI